MTVTTPDDVVDPDEPFLFDDSLAGDMRDPYPELAELRRTTPILASPEGNSFVVFRHEDVAHVLHHNETFTSGLMRDVMGAAMGDYIILGMDEPEHRRHRALVSTAFRQKTLQRWEDGLVRRVIDELVDRFRPRGRAELVREFTFHFPSRVIAGVFGLPDEHYQTFQRWAVAIVGLHNDWERGVTAGREMKAYLAEVLADRRANPRPDDLLSDLAHAELDGERLDDEEIFSFVRLLLPAGVETTYRSSGNLILLLLQHADQLEAVRDDRSLLPMAIEEGLRFEPPLLLTSRGVAHDTELCGTPVPAGSSVTVMLGAANRDETYYDDPDRFDIRRPPKPHISFGHGPHMCLGMHLARMETRLALDALLDLPNLRLDPDAKDPHIRGQIFRSPNHVPVLFG